MSMSLPLAKESTASASSAFFLDRAASSFDIELARDLVVGASVSFSVDPSLFPVFSFRLARALPVLAMNAFQEGIRITVFHRSGDALTFRSVRVLACGSEQETMQLRVLCMEDFSSPETSWNGAGDGVLRISLEYGRLAYTVFH